MWVQWRSVPTAIETEDGETTVRVTNVVELRSADELSAEVASAIAEVSQLPNGEAA
jgi:hypothetical protein